MWIQEEQKMADKETEQIKKLNQTVHSKGYKRARSGI